MNTRTSVVGAAASALAMLVGLTACESTNGGGGGSVGFSYGYYGGYYAGYPGYWYDDDDAVIVRPPEDRPDRPGGPERPTTLPSDLPDKPSTKPSTTQRSSSSMSRSMSRPMPRARSGRR
jgi:hypothetical protein